MNLDYHNILNATLNYQNRVPFYFQIKQIIIEQIESGKIKPGEMLPFEAQLCDLFKVSRTVIRQALQELKNENYIITRKGKGTFIAERQVNESIIQNLLGFYETWTALGFKVENEVLRNEKMICPEKYRDLLNLKKDEEVILLKRLSKLNGSPFSISDNYIVYSFTPGILDDDFKDTGLYTLLNEKYKVELTHSKSSISIALASKEEAELLGIKRNEPLFAFEGTSYIENGTPIVHYRSLQLGQRSKIHLELAKKKTKGSHIKNFENAELLNFTFDKTFTKK